MPGPVVEFYIMPLSRYWAEDYIHPMMRRAWQSGTPCQAVDAVTGAVRTLAPNTPMGGPDAAANRTKSLPKVREKLHNVPGGDDGVWDEASTIEPRFYFTPTVAFEALLRDVQPYLVKMPVHVATANIFVPIAFDDPKKVAGDIYGSLFRLGTEMRTLTWTGAARPAVEAILVAVQEATILQMPLIIVR
jgi:hypothetical protein